MHAIWQSLFISRKKCIPVTGNKIWKIQVTYLHQKMIMFVPVFCVCSIMHLICCTSVWKSSKFDLYYLAKGARVCLSRKPSVPDINAPIALNKAIFVSKNLLFSSPEHLPITEYNISRRWNVARSLEVSPRPLCMDFVIMMSVKRRLGTRYLRFVIYNDSNNITCNGSVQLYAL